MEIKAEGVRSKCCACCKADAKYEIILKKSLMGSVALCENCLREMYSEIGKILIPKSPENIIKKKLEVRS